ncbi:hypothetical protein [Flaviaesturariibacter amylovorans]|uniref:YqaJ viral recombinase domain-containing protein n=1 Tax=Flaviaesturariibacter amylovorans TaxID=1084520 RepID=A0ABP8GQ79_9BACT
MNFSNYEFRCSALGKIMSPSGKWTQSNETYLHELFIGEINGIRKEINSKYFEKGKYMEEDGITLLNASLYAGRLLVKNKERKHNGWIHGEADCIAPDGIVYDIKNAWDRFTFGKASLTWEYEWQLRGYMWLWAKEKASLFYCLNNMPEHLLVAEEKKLFYAGNYLSIEDPDYLEACDELRYRNNYDGMPLFARFRVWDVAHCEEKIAQLQERITKCRQLLAEMWGDYEGELRSNIERMGLDPVEELKTYSLTATKTVPAL